MPESAQRPKKLIIQIPCFNEAGTLATTLADLPREVPGVDSVEWLVIDDGSIDDTADVARANGVDHVVTHTRNRGLAAAFLTGLDAALHLGADVIVNTDADNQYVADCIPELIAPVCDGSADMVVGERPITAIDDFSWTKKKLQRFGSWVVRRFSGTDVADAPSGFRAIGREAALRLQVFGKFSYTMETLVQANAEGLAVSSVPVRVNPFLRPSRLAKSTFQYLLRSSQTIVRSFALYYPMKFFFRIGVLPFLLGMILVIRWGLLFLFEDPYRSRVPSLVVGAVLLIFAVQIWVVAFLADLQAATRRMLAEARVRERRRARADGA
ncbi:glycosyltransferase family 2 protein [Ilumatobacter sp.]|uniref:glycosyltransferase family 2 protein n=1 Tax=Ilumatobacter sp. TaxID=1967498 RepID=UPI003AF61B75